MDQRKQFLGDIKNILHFFLQDLTILPCHGVPTKLSSPSISSATCLSPLVRNCENPLRNKNLNYVAVSPNIYLSSQIFQDQRHLLSASIFCKQYPCLAPIPDPHHLCERWPHAVVEQLLTIQISIHYKSEQSANGQEQH